MQTRPIFWAMMMAAAAVASPAAADVVASSATSFEINQSTTIDRPIAEVWEMLRSPQKWWDKAHTYSGDSASLYLDAQATGCFCERLPGKGSVEHAHIVFIQPPRMIRMRGALGPLQAEAVTGTLTWKLEPEGDNATRLTMSYVVGGYIRSGGEAMAPQVDEVLATQMLALKTAAEAAPPMETAPTK